MFAVHDLAVLVAVAESGSVRRAAAVLGRTQPAVSQAIQRLEEAVGFSLLDRSGYRARLTERGETFVKRARASVTQARELQTFATVLSRGVEARLRLVVHGAIPVADWMPLVEDMESRFPHTVLEIQVGEGDAPMRHLMSDEADLAVVLSPAKNRLGTVLELRQLGLLEFVTVVQSRRLVSNLDADLASLPQILVADYDDAATGYGIVEGHRYWRVSDHRIKAALIAAGTGWGSVPAPLVESALTAGTLSSISYRGMEPRTQQPYFLCRKLERAHGPAASFVWGSDARAAP
jgi:DNA-binding transcriptional LysR family regulator